jgi:hypothetical protein
MRAGYVSRREKIQDITMRYSRGHGKSITTEVKKENDYENQLVAQPIKKISW